MSMIPAKLAPGVVAEVRNDNGDILVEIRWSEDFSSLDGFVGGILVCSVTEFCHRDNMACMVDTVEGFIEFLKAFPKPKLN